MTAVSIGSELYKSVQCPICFDTFKDPRNLPCSHSFCRECLDALLQFNGDGSASLECPNKCGCVVELKADETTFNLGKNYSLQAVVDAIETNSDQISVKCGAADCNNNVKYFCSACTHRYCAKCSSNHGCNNGQLTLTELNEKSGCFEQVCEEHHTYAIRMCRDCDDRFICIYCAERFHRGHIKESLGEYITRVMYWLDDNVKRTESYLSEAKLAYSEGLLRFDEYRREMEGELDKRQLKKITEVIRELNEDKMKKLAFFDQAVATFKNSLEKDSSDEPLGVIKERIEKLETKSSFEVVTRERQNVERKLNKLLFINCFEGILKGVDSTEPGNILGTLDVQHVKESVKKYIYCFHDIIKFKMNKTYLLEAEELEDVSKVTKYLQDLTGDAGNTKMAGNFDRIDELKTKEDKEIIKRVEKYSFDDIYKIVREDDINELKLLIKYKPELLAKTSGENDETIEHKIAPYPNVTESLKLLVKSQVIPVNQLDKTGYAPLIAAATYGNIEYLKLLLENGANVDFASHEHKLTALMVAAEQDYPQCVKLLLQNNADVTLKDHKGRTAHVMTDLDEIKKLIDEHTKN